MSIKIYRKLYLILFLFLQQKIKSEEIEDNKYSFQLYNSHETEKPYYFYAQTNKNLIVINSTEGDNNSIIEQKTTNEFLYKEMSSVSLIDDIYLVKTCFGPDNLVEVLYKNKETYTKKNNNFSKIKFCYSTKVKNPFIRPINPDEYVIITYWTEIESITDRERYAHKCILFYPSSNTFSEEFILSSESKFVVYIYYPEKCTTFRDEDIFCVIHFSPDDDSLHIIGNHYVIETSKIFLDYNYHYDSSIYLVVGNSVLTSTNYQIPISLGKSDTIPIIGGRGDIYMTEFHNYNKKGNGRTLLLYSYYIKQLKNKFIRQNYIPYFEAINLFFGLNIQDKYIHQNLFNHLIPNKDELIIIYISKDTKTSLLLSRFDINDSKSKFINNNFKEISNYNYIRTDICLEPKYLQSIYINSFINYDNNDKNIIKNNPNKNYYKYQKDIGVLISCEQNNDIHYESKKIEMPQCLNILDVINGNNKHKLKYEENQKEIIFDIYGDPNLKSLRNVEINFNTSALFSFLILMQVKQKGESTFKNITYDRDYKTVTHIKFIRKYNLAIKKPLILPYRIKQNKINKNNIVSQLISDICNIEFSTENNIGPVCEIDFCIICKSETICESCDSTINGIIRDNKENSENYGKCICNEDKGFNKMPNKQINRCVCKDNYSFYLNINQCKSNIELENQPFYIIDIDIITNTNIYGDCYITCKKCSKEGSKEEHNCDECKDGYIKIGNNCYSFIPDTTKETETSISSTTVFDIDQNTNSKDVCLYENKVWFQLGKYKFNYAKIDKCVFIYDGSELFFISNRIQCKSLINNYNYTMENISRCLSNSDLDNKIEYIDFIENAKEYKQNSNNITIYKNIDKEKKYFHLYNHNSQINFKNITKLYFDENIKIDLLIFKVDIKRDDTISSQVEYQFYNPKPENIDQKININEYLSKKRRLQNKDNNKIIYLDIPISLQQEKLEKIKELNNSGIDAFNSSSEFYLDVCNQYTTPNKDDIFLQERKNEYYPDELYCEENCEFVKYNLDTEKVTCKCSPKENTDNFEKVKFKLNDKDEKFKKTFTSPNLKVMKCWSIFGKNLNKNNGFFLSLILLIIFILIFLYLIFIGFKEIKEKLEKENSENINNISDLDISALCEEPKNPTEPKVEPIDPNTEIKNSKKNTELQPIDVVNDISSTILSNSKSSIKNNSSSSKNNSNAVNNNGINNNDKPNFDTSQNPIKTHTIFVQNNQKERNGENNNINDNREDSVTNKEDNNKIIQNDNNNTLNKEENKKNENEGDKSDKKNNINNLKNSLAQKNKKTRNIHNINININNLDKNKNNNNNNNNKKIKDVKESKLDTKMEPFNADYSKDSDKFPRSIDNFKSLNESANVNDSSKPNISQKSSSELIDETRNENKIKESEIQNETINLNINEELKKSENIKESKNTENLINSDMGVSRIDNNNEQKDISCISLSIIGELDKDKDKDEDKSNISNVKKNTMIQKEGKRKTIPKSEKQKRDKEKQKRKEEREREKEKEKEKEREKEKLNKNKESVYVADPPKKNSLGNSENQNMGKNEQNSERSLMRNKKDSEDDDNYTFDKMEFNNLIEEKKKGKGDNRNIFKMFLPVLKNNSTIYYTYNPKSKDNKLLRISILILCFSFYVCLNVFLAFNMSMVQVYINFNLGYCILNIFIPCFLCVPMILIRKFMSQKELLCKIAIYKEKKINKSQKDKNSKKEEIKNSEDKERNEIIKEIDNYKKSIYIYGISGILFLIFNWILVTSFCGIYPNSIGSLTLNTFISMIGEFVISAIFYLIGSTLRFYSLKKEKQILFFISRLFNPINLVDCTKKEEKKEKQNLHKSPPPIDKK